VLLAEGVLADGDDCEPIVALAELLVWPLEDASGVAVLEALVLGAVLLELWLLISPEALDCGVELLALFGLVEELELLFGVVEASGVVPVVLLWEEELPRLLVELCELVLAEFGEVLELFGEVLSGVLLVEGVELVPGCVEVVDPALPLMLPAVLFVEVEELLVEAAVPAAPAVAVTWISSFTFFTPATDLASFFASFLSSLLLTEPVNFTVPLSTSTCTPCRFGLLASCSCTCLCSVWSSTMTDLLSLSLSMLPVWSIVELVLDWPMVSWLVF
jgi:hypothetical protein